MRILALDADTNSVGWVLGDDDQFLEGGTFHPEGEDVWQRICTVAHWLLTMHHDHLLDVIGYELPAGDHENRDTDRKLATLMGACLFAASGLCGLRFEMVHPAAVKASGYHKGLVNHAAWRIQKEPDQITEHEADAVGVWATNGAPALD